MKTRMIRVVVVMMVVVVVVIMMMMRTTMMMMIHVSRVEWVRWYAPSLFNCDTNLNCW